MVCFGNQLYRIIQQREQSVISNLISKHSHMKVSHHSILILVKNDESSTLLRQQQPGALTCSLKYLHLLNATISNLQLIVMSLGNIYNSACSKLPA